MANDNDKTNVISMADNKNHVTVLATKWKELETNMKNWIENPPLMLEAAIAAVNGGAVAAVGCYYLETLFLVACAVRPPPFVSLKAIRDTRLNRARDMAVWVGAEAGISRAVTKIRGKVDAEARMVSGFGAGVLMAMVRRDPPAVVILSGVFVAIAEVGIFKVKEKMLKKEA